MTTVSELDDFFQNHPLQQQYFQFTAAERSGAAAVAGRDVAAALEYRDVPAEKQEFVTAAVAEQALFLLLNPEYLTGTAAPPLNVRSQALLKPLSAEPEEEPEIEPEDAEYSGTVRLSRG